MSHAGSSKLLTKCMMLISVEKQQFAMWNWCLQVQFVARFWGFAPDPTRGAVPPPGPPPPAWVDRHGLGHQKYSIQFSVPEPFHMPGSGSRGRLWNGLQDCRRILPRLVGPSLPPERLGFAQRSSISRTIAGKCRDSFSKCGHFMKHSCLSINRTC